MATEVIDEQDKRQGSGTRPNGECADEAKSASAQIGGEEPSKALAVYRAPSLARSQHFHQGDCGLLA